MVRKKIDNRIRVQIENGVAENHRTLFVIVGDRGRDQVVILHHMLTKATIKARPSVLWCYKKELGFSSHRKKKIKQIKKKMKSGKINVKEDDPFELFISATTIRYCYYADTHKILGNTYGMCVLQDFEALTPNLLARTIETVEGGGIIVVLLKTMSSLKQLYTMTMDVHTRYRTEAHQDVVGRFNERFILSLTSCKNCLVIDDDYNLLPFSSHALNIQPLPAKSVEDSVTPLEQELRDLKESLQDTQPVENLVKCCRTFCITVFLMKKEDSVTPLEQELRDLKESLQDTQPVGNLVKCCRTVDQAKALLKFVEAISEKTLRSTVVMTAARGRGKSAALGLAMATAVGFGYSNIFVTSPSPENLKTLFEFVFKGFDALEYQEHVDYEIIQSTNPDFNKAIIRVNIFHDHRQTIQFVFKGFDALEYQEHVDYEIIQSTNPDFNKAIIRVNIFHDHRQTIQYIHPSDAQKLGQAELVCIDEAAAIPLPLVKSLMGPYLVFMSSTVNGYEGTGRSLSLKLIHQLRQQSSTYGSSSEIKKTISMSFKTNDQSSSSTAGRVLHEIVLNESIRYANEDPVESWLNNLLCLNCGEVQRISSGCPLPDQCDLYYVNRDTLFSYHKASEGFLHRIMSLYVSSHYKNTPNDLQLLSDAPAHHIYVLLGPVNPDQAASLPEVLCVLQVCLEGEISKSTIMNSLSRGKRGSGDLIPWTVSQQFQDNDFPRLSGARVVRIATHPDYQGMGYGSRALTLLQQYYEGKIQSIHEDADETSQATNVRDDEVGLLEERIKPRKNLPPLLVKLNERRAERLDYLGVSYGLTSELLRFWKKAGYVPVYLRQTPNELTGEHSCIMLKTLQSESETEGQLEGWLPAFFKDFRRRFVSLLSYQFKAFTPAMSLNVIQQKQFKDILTCAISRSDLECQMTKYDIKRLELYSQNMVDYHLIMDLIPTLSRMYFLEQLPVHLTAVQAGVMLGLGLQHKTIEDLEKEIDLPVSQLLGLFTKIIRKMVAYLNQVLEKDMEKEMVEKQEIMFKPTEQTLEEDLLIISALEKDLENEMVEKQEIAFKPTEQTLEEDLDEGAAEIKKKAKQQAGFLQGMDLSQYQIKGSENDWEKVLTSGKKTVSVKSTLLQKRKQEDLEKDNGIDDVLPKHKKKSKKKHRS